MGQNLTRVQWESFAANGYGLFDMSGNVNDWCNDWYGTYVGNCDPAGASSGSHRVFRGGNWSYGASACRVAVRLNSYPGISDGHMGFRPVFRRSE